MQLTILDRAYFWVTYLEKEANMRIKFKTPQEPGTYLHICRADGSWTLCGNRQKNMSMKPEKIDSPMTMPLQKTSSYWQESKPLKRNCKIIGRRQTHEAIP